MKFIHLRNEGLHEMLNIFYPFVCRRKHVWNNFCLSFGKEKLVDDDARLHDFGIRNNDEVCYLTSQSSRHFWC